ncbi:site-specific integrase [Acidaminobacter hydrogenoformans]|uniref:site-specific integrase n=1 Tax=Acidaminobacter hydrogenoformans TaxID=65403 RepID=UPI00147DFD2B|nr:site-specific integrase [Acidaminobacter hydrogenoformans]
MNTKGYIEEHSPSTDHIFTGEFGKLILLYLDHMANVLKRKTSTVRNAELYLFRFYCFLSAHRYDISNLSFDVIENFHREQDYTMYIVSDNYHFREGKLPSTYSEEEIRTVLYCVDRSSAIGKRDYLFLILTAEYGLRNGDIRQFRLDHIDWDRNEIRFYQDKTSNSVTFPLLSSVGNAIIDYLKNGRPITDTIEIILSVKPSRKSKTLSASAVSSIAAKYFGKSGLSALNARHKGTHVFRHSLASNMLAKEVPLLVISDVLGHSSTESTKTYLKVDFKQLKRCALPMPANHSPFYQRGGIWL